MSELLSAVTRSCGDVHGQVHEVGTDLMYLGQAGGVAIVFDVDAETTVRLPARDVTVTAESTKSSNNSPIKSRCED
ncbi:hypothetical protein [Nocardia pseudovaccinii]|uniref:hypothetical protein n=1 Tax=Nocardia pseudovaccinii TaxID=189540 RepID=UPI0007A52C3F|nr:hypothetical protein [Nocardia pseudovaccinii]